MTVHTVLTAAEKGARPLRLLVAMLVLAMAEPAPLLLMLLLLPLPLPLTVRAAVLQSLVPLQPMFWRCWPWLGTPRLTPPTVAGVMSTCCCVLYMGLRYSTAFTVAIWLVLWLAAASTALLVVTQAVMLQRAEAALQVA